MLGAHFGILHVERDILKRLPAKEFLRWEAYHQIAPFGEWRADVRAAQITSMLHNVNVATDKQKKLGDFLIDWQKAAEEAEKKAEAAASPVQTWQQKLAIAHMWVKAFTHARPPKEEGG